MSKIDLSELDFMDSGLDGFSPREPDKVRPPEWYYDEDVKQPYKDIVDEAMKAFEEKLAFIHGLKPGTKVSVKERKLVVAKINEAVGLKKNYLTNRSRPDIKRIHDFIAFLNHRLNAVFDAKPAENVRRTASDLKGEVQALREQNFKLRGMQFGEYAKAAFQQNMAARLEAQNHSYASLFQKNNELFEENENLKRENEKIRRQLGQANSEVSRLRAAALKVVSNG